MEYEVACHTVGVDSTEYRRLTFGKRDDAEYEDKEEKQYSGSPNEAFLFADSTIDKVCVLFRHIFKLSLSAVEKPFTENAPEPMAILDWLTL